MKFYTVTYIVCGIHYTYRCTAKTKAEAKKNCHKAMGVKYKDITECELEYTY